MPHDFLRCLQESLSLITVVNPNPSLRKYVLPTLKFSSFEEARMLAATKATLDSSVQFAELDASKNYTPASASPKRSLLSRECEIVEVVLCRKLPCWRFI